MQQSLLDVPEAGTLWRILNRITALINEKQVLLILTWSSHVVMMVTHDFSLRIAHSF